MKDYENGKGTPTQPPPSKRGGVKSCHLQVRSVPPRFSRGRLGGGFGLALASLHQFNKVVEQSIGIVWAGARFWVTLEAERGLVGAVNTLQ